MHEKKAKASESYSGTNCVAALTHRNLATWRLAVVVIINLIELHTDYDYQYCWVRLDRVLVTTFWTCRHRQRSWFPMVSISLPAIFYTLLLMTPKADKFLLEMETVAHDNNWTQSSWTLNPSHQTFIAPCSTDNRSRLFKFLWFLG